MALKRLVAPLFLDYAESEEGFRSEIERLACRGLRVVALIQFVIPLFVLVARFWIVPEPATVGLRTGESILMVVLGFSSLVLSRIQCLRCYSRGISFAAGVVSSGILTVFSLLIGLESFVTTQIAMVLMVAVSVIPALPYQILMFGLTQGLIYYIASVVIARETGSCQPAGALEMFSVVVVTMLSTLVATVVSRQRYASYHSYLRSLKAAEEVSQAQSQMLLSEYSASLGRISAAISHEVNSPLGTLISGVDTLLLLASRQVTTPPENHPRLVQLQADVRQSLLQSAQRLRGILARMERFTNLDRAEIMPVDVNGLLTDVAGMIEPQLNGDVRLELDLAGVPPITCRPQRLSAAFFNIISNAVSAVDGAGTVRVVSRGVDSRLEVTVRDSGRGMSAEQLEDLFNPDFRSVRGRVRSANWGMFSSRQIIREHGGEIQVSSVEGAGTTITIQLPLSEDTAAKVA